MIARRVAQTAPHLNLGLTLSRSSPHQSICMNCILKSHTSQISSRLYRTRASIPRSSPNYPRQPSSKSPQVAQRASRSNRPDKREEPSKPGVSAEFYAQFSKARGSESHTKSTAGQRDGGFWGGSKGRSDRSTNAKGPRASQHYAKTQHLDKREKYSRNGARAGSYAKSARDRGPGKAFDYPSHQGVKTDEEREIRKTLSRGHSRDSREPATLEDEPLWGKPNFEGQAHIGTLKALRSIPLPGNTTPPEPRQAIASANKFFQMNYRFLFSSSSIQNQPPNPHVPEIVVLGASNAGKSSFLNGLFGRTDAARVSSKAGHTITMNGHGIGRPGFGTIAEKNSTPRGHGLVMMDTPGYGYKSRHTWGDEIHRYIEKRDMLKGAILLIPANKKISDMDRWVLRLLASCNKRTLIVFTKADSAGREWMANCDLQAHKIKHECKLLSEELNSGWKEGDGLVSKVYATAAGWKDRASVGDAPGMAGVRKAILEELAGFQLGQSKVEAAPGNKAYEGDLVSWDSLMGESDDGDLESEEGGVDEEEAVEDQRRRR